MSSLSILDSFCVFWLYGRFSHSLLFCIFQGTFLLSFYLSCSVWSWIISWCLKNYFWPKFTLNVFVVGRFLTLFSLNKTFLTALSVDPSVFCYFFEFFSNFSFKLKFKQNLLNFTFGWRIFKRLRLRGIQFPGIG